MYSNIYWLTRIGYLHDFLLLLAVLPAFVSALFVFGYFTSSKDYGEADERFEMRRSVLLKWLRRIVWMPLVFGLLTVLTPTRGDLLLIYAGGKAYEYVRSDSALQKLPYKTTEYLKVILEREIQEAKEKSK